MKKFFYIIASIMVLSAVSTSCSGLLEEKNYGNPTVEDMMKA